MASRRARDEGFTLIELLMAIAIIGILASLAVPSFVQVIADQRVKAAATNLFTALNVTRSEAIKHNTRVVLTPKVGNWANGWVVLDPEGGRNLLDENGTGVPITGGPASVTYNGSGRLSGATTAPSFTIGESGKPQRCLSVDLSGRPNVKASRC